MSCGSPRAGHRRPPGCRWCSRDLLYVVGVGRDALADLVVGAVHLGVVCVDVLAREAEQLVVVGAFEAVPAWAVDGSHLVLLVFGLCGSDGFRGLGREPPFGPALLEAPRRAPGRLQAADGLVRVGAERAAAVSHDLTAGWKLGEALLELIERDRARAVDVPGGELLLRTDVDQDHVAAAEPGDELIAADRLDVVAEVVTRCA